MSFFNVSIFTPSKVILRNVPVDELIIPTTGGQINVLPEHTHFVTQIDTGIISLKNSQGSQHLFCTTGICKILKNEVIILPDVCEKSVEIDRARAEKSLAKTKELLSGRETLSEMELIKYQRKLARAEVRIKLALTTAQ